MDLRFPAALALARNVWIAAITSVDWLWYASPSEDVQLRFFARLASRNRWKLRQSLHTRIPGLFTNVFRQRLSRETLVFVEPIVGDRHLVGKRSGCQHLCNECIRIQRDRRH